MNKISFFDDIASWIKNLWGKMDLESWLKKIGITSPQALKSIKYCLVAFVVGFLFKRYFKFILVCSVIIILFGVILNAKSILSVNWDNVKSLLSFDPAKTTLQNLIVNFFHWVKNNLLVFIVLSLSFLLGYKLG